MQIKYPKHCSILKECSFQPERALHADLEASVWANRTLFPMPHRWPPPTHAWWSRIHVEGAAATLNRLRWESLFNDLERLSPMNLMENIETRANGETFFKMVF